jgi:outer membrane immunogenic protein
MMIISEREYFNARIATVPSQQLGGWESSRGMDMRKTAITLAGTTAIGLCLGVSAGSAADMGLPVKAAPVVPFTWTGCYAGVQAGIGAQTDGFATNSVAGDLPFEGFSGNGANGWGAIAGGQIGCNYQINQLVVGIEGDGVWSSIQNTSGFTDPDGEGVRLRTKNLWDADVALRVGAAFDRLLVYGKGGVAWGGFSFNESFTGIDTGDSISGSRVLPGLLIGVGMEYAFFANWSAKIEYNYIAYAQEQIGFNEYVGGVLIPGEHFSEAFGGTKQIIKFGVNYKFW